jgi:hypothetical protein
MIKNDKLLGSRSCTIFINGLWTSNRKVKTVFEIVGRISWCRSSIAWRERKLFRRQARDHPSVRLITWFTKPDWWRAATEHPILLDYKPCFGPLMDYICWCMGLLMLLEQVDQIGLVNRWVAVGRQQYVPDVFTRLTSLEVKYRRFIKEKG